MNNNRNVKYATLVGNRAENPLSVYPIADDAIRIEENSMTGIRKFETLQYTKSFILKKISGNKVSIIERTSPLEKKNINGLRMEFSDDGFRFFENNRLIKSDSNIRINEGETHLFRIIQDGDYTTTIMDCDTIANQKTAIPASEYTVFRTDKSTEIEIYSFDVVDLYGNKNLFN
ncbi:hypothetical protein EP342_01635 [bacterium]|nr:MAG: hypothetical protein EP342_01635 [bacterium]